MRSWIRSGREKAKAMMRRDFPKWKVEQVYIAQDGMRKVWKLPRARIP